MAQEFDIYLKRCTTICDLLMQSLPYREGFTISDRILIESCIDAYVLKKLIAVHNGADVKILSHIDETLKICLEKFDDNILLDIDAPEMKRSLEHFDGELPFSFGVDKYDIYKIMGYFQNDISFMADVEQIVRVVFNHIDNNINFLSDVESMQLTKYVDYNSIVALTSEVVDLLRMAVDSFESSLGLKSEAEVILSRYRTLVDMDNDALGYYDNLTIFDTDLIVV